MNANTRENKTNLKPIMTYGAILGLGLVALYFIAYLSGLYFSKLIGWVAQIAFFGGLYHSIKTYRDKFLDGYIKYGQSVKIGLLVCVFAGFLIGIYQHVLMASDAELFEESIIQQEEMFLKMGFSEEMVELQAERLREGTTPFQSALSGALGFGFIGLLVSLIMSIFLKKTRDPFEEAMNEIKE
jgi:hypothetical protein